MYGSSEDRVNVSYSWLLFEGFRVFTPGHWLDEEDEHGDPDNPNP